METRDRKVFQQHFETMDLDTPEVILISGLDPAILDLILESIQKRLTAKIGRYEFTLLTGEPGDEDRFLEETFNVPLFASYRLVVVRQAEEVFRPILASSSRAAACRENFRHLPERTLVVLQYEGAPPGKFLKLFENLCHFSSRELYSNQIMETIRAGAKKLGLRMTEDVLHEIGERVEPKNGAIELALLRIRDMLPVEKQGHAEPDDIREILYPTVGCNPFQLIDALFRQDHEVVRRELARFRKSSDNLPGILKLILNRTNEIRKATLARSMGMSDREIMVLLNYGSRHPFFQKKTLQRLTAEMGRFSEKRLGKIYEFLVGFHKDIRHQIPWDRQLLIFQQRILEVFFYPASAYE